MKAMLLAAGRGTRLAPLTRQTPKILAPIAGRTLLAHQLEYLQRGGVSEIAINVHHQADQVLDHLASLEPQTPVRVSREPRLLGTAGALLPLRDFFDRPTILLYGDVLTDADLTALMEEHLRGGALATLAAYPSNETAGKGVIALDDASSRRIVEFQEKPAGAPAQALISAGIYVISPEVLDLIGPADGRERDFGRDVWPKALACGWRLHASVLDGYVRDVGSPQALAAAQADMTAGALSW